MRTGRRGSGAQSVVEFALCVPFLLLLLFAIIDFSRLLFTYVSLTNGTRELARMAALSDGGASATAPLDMFNNLTIIGGLATSPGDANQVTITWVNSYCAAHGGPPCTTPGRAIGPVTCTLPLSSANCSMAPPWDRTLFYDGYVDVTTTYTFRFAPLFENRFASISFMQPLTQLSTSVRETIE